MSNITYSQARRTEIEDYIARASARITEIHAQYGNQTCLQYQDAAANIAIIEAQHHAERITALRAELGATGE